MGLFDPHSIFAYSTVATVVSQASNTLVLTVQSGDGARFQVGQQVTLGPSNIQVTYANGMIGRITAIATDQLTIDYSSANREGSQVRTVQVGDGIINGITPKILADIENLSNVPEGYLINGKITTTVTSNNLT